jgi:hypothetical protein
VDIPVFLYPVIVLEALAVLAIIWGLWFLLSNKGASELDSGPQPRGRSVAATKASGAVDTSPTDKARKSVDAKGLTSTRFPAAKPVDSHRPAIASAENASDEVDPSWPPPTPKSS